MKIRTARKIAKRVFGRKPSLCPYDEMQLFRAFSRLHTEWRKRRSVTVRDGGNWLGVTEDFFRENDVDSMRIRMRFFRHSKYNPEASRNATIDSWVRKTWSPPHS